jgi:hypothetical protein
LLRILILQLVRGDFFDSIGQKLTLRSTSICLVTSADKWFYDLARTFDEAVDNGTQRSGF